MKLTPEAVLHEDAQPVKSPKRAPKEKPPKPERTKKSPKKGRKKRHPEPEEAEDLIKSGDPGMDEPYEDVPKRGSKVKTILLILLMALGFVVFVINMKGFVGTLSLEKNPPAPSESFDASYQDALDAEEEDFDEVNSQRKEKAKESAAEEKAEESAAEETEEPDTVSDASDTGDAPSTSSEDEVSRLKAEVERLRTEAETAKK